MRLTIPQPFLADALAKGGSVTGKENISPILTHVRLSTKGDTLFIASTDGDRFAEVAVSAEIEVQGAITVSAAALSALISRYPKDGAVTLDLEAPGLLRVKCGRSRVGLLTMPTSGFPKWEPAEDSVTFKIAGGELASAFARMRPIASTAPITWQGFYVEPKNGALNVSAFNGFAMVWLKLPMPEGAENAPPMILSQQTVDTFSKLFKGGEVTVHASAGKVVFEADGVGLSSRLMDGAMPPYLRMIEKRGELAARFDRKEFMTCLERAALATEREGALNMVTATPSADGLELRTRNHKGGDASEPMDAVVDDGFAPVGFTPADLAAIMTGIESERVVVEEVITDKRYLFFGEGDDSFLAAAAPIRIGAR